jgi:hypothetical protein
MLQPKFDFGWAGVCCEFSYAHAQNTITMASKLHDNTISNSSREGITRHRQK